MTPKMTIYVPTDLAEQVRNAPGFNMSQVAQEAFRAALRRREVSADVVTRLRQTLDEQQAERQERSRELGAEWARDYATVPELEALAELDARGGRLTAYTEEHTLDDFLYDERDVDLDALVQGALEVWNAVRNDVYGGGGENA